MKRLEPQLLERYYDGELEGRARRRVEEHLADSPEDRAALERLASLSAAMGEAREEQLAGVSFDGFEKRVLNGLERTEPAGGLERLRVWVAEVLEHRRRIWVPSAAIAGAAAAMLLVIPLVTGAPAAPATMPGDGAVRVYSAGGPRAAPGATAGRGSEILSVRGATSWAPYQVRNAQGESMAVAWINE